MADTKLTLFSSLPGSGWNADLASNRSPRAFSTYAQGYFRAALALLHRGGDDLLFYPAAFAFRHGVELALKSLARDFGVVGEVEPLGRPTHPLADIWTKIREPMTFYQLEGLLEPVPDLSADELGAVIEELDRTDERSMAFRYPCSLDGEPHLDRMSRIDMVQFASVAERVALGLTAWMDWVGERADDKRLSEWRDGS